MVHTYLSVWKPGGHRGAQLEGSGRVLLLPAASIVQVDVKALLEVRVPDEVIAVPAKACDQTNDAWYNFDSVVVRGSHRSLRTPYVEVRA